MSYKMMNKAREAHKDVIELNDNNIYIVIGTEVLDGYCFSFILQSCLIIGG